MSRKILIWGGAGFALLLLSVVVSLSMGTASLPVSQVWSILWHQLPYVGDWVTPDWPVSSEQIILKVRLPRVLLAILIGACLSLAGAGFQGVLRNPLADPYTLGVASGSAVGAALVILFGLQVVLLGQWMIPAVAFVTGMLSLFIVLRLAIINGKFQLETLILSGVVVQAFLGSMVSFMVSLSDKVINEIIFWLMGSLSLRGWSFTLMLVPYFLIGLAVLLSYGRTLNLFALGERQAEHLGVNVVRTRMIVLCVSTLITAAAVSVAGTIGFVGLVVPHLVRLMVGPDYRILLPVTAIFGGIYLLWADTLARMLLSPTEIPLGVVTAFLGAPFFAYLLRKNKKRLGA
ncbi:FecCD family ABC transporter permease [Cohnella cholangitidis]|uniref:Iron ABC transporter permease n=1 Tax=Cohnella cholangitidis TaxID=2598458 RepID=A0A7G5BWZ7_9BACL|nr:iron chelate uptake ABC transporter family permease subunit [Cohnella cholangitidis]QMV41481.1 iron ABC transporter permease [Cohnella cholangitidis]